MQIIEVNTIEQLNKIKELFIEYHQSLNIDLCFQDFHNEIDNLPGKYAKPFGAMLLAMNNKEAIGCVALRRINKRECEVKRLYVKNQYRGNRIGEELLSEIIKKAINIGYKNIKLDTLRRMKSAIGLYKKLGFKETKAYIYNPIKDVVYLELNI